MLKVLIACSNRASLSELESTLEEYDDVSLLKASSMDETLELASEKTPDLVISDERIGNNPGLELANRLLSINPMIACAIVSTLTPEAFHEASEGLGIMSQLPARPGREHVESLLSQLRKIKNLTSPSDFRMSVQT